MEGLNLRVKWLMVIINLCFLFEVLFLLLSISSFFFRLLSPFFGYFILKFDQIAEKIDYLFFF